MVIFPSSFRQCSILHHPRSIISQCTLNPNGRRRLPAFQAVPHPGFPSCLTARSQTLAPSGFFKLDICQQNFHQGTRFVLDSEQHNFTKANLECSLQCRQNSKNAYCNLLSQRRGRLMLLTKRKHQKYSATTGKKTIIMLGIFKAAKDYHVEDSYFRLNVYLYENTSI